MDIRFNRIAVVLLAASVMLSGCGSANGTVTDAPAAEVTKPAVQEAAKTPEEELPSAVQIMESVIGSYSDGEGNFRETKQQLSLTGGSEFVFEGFSTGAEAAYSHRIDTSVDQYIFEGSMTCHYSDDGIDVTDVDEEAVYAGTDGTFYKQFRDDGGFDWVEKSLQMPFERNGFHERASRFLEKADWLTSGEVSGRGTNYVITGTADTVQLSRLAGTVSERAAGRILGLIERMSGYTEEGISFRYELCVSKKTSGITSFRIEAHPAEDVSRLELLVTFSTFTGELDIPEGMGGISEAEANAYINGDTEYNHEYDYSGASDWTTADSELAVSGMHFDMKAREGFFYHPLENRFLLEVGRTVTDYDYSVKYYDPDILLSVTETEAEEKLVEDGRSDTVYRTDTRYGHVIWTISGQNDGGTFITAYECIDGVEYYLAYTIGCYVPCDDIEALVGDFSVSRLCMEEVK